jgi:hypothetical protein
MNKIDNFLNNPNLIKEFWYKYIDKGAIQMCLQNKAKAETEIADSFTSLLPSEDFFLPLIYDLKTKIEQNHIDRQKIYVRRWHINISPTGFDGTMHEDNYFDCPTFLYCLAPFWDPEWGGEFILYDQNKEAIDVCSFKTDRMIIFNGSVTHRGVAPTRLSSLLRVTIAFQTELLEKTEN